MVLLANNKKDTLQAIHTSFVNRAIDNIMDNRLFNNQPPPINDKETFLSFCNLVLLILNISVDQTIICKKSYFRRNYRW